MRSSRRSIANLGSQAPIASGEVILKMGMDNSSILKLIALVLVAVVAGGLLFGNISIPDLGNFSIGDQQEKPPEDDVEMVATADYEVDGKMTLPTTISSGDIYLFTEKPAGDAPIHYSDYVDFSANDAITGLTEGVDYHKVSLSSADTATFTNLDAGNYHAVSVDKSSPREYHYEFFTVEMPEQVEKFRVEQNQPVNLARKGDFTRMASYKSDDTVAYNADRSKTVSLSADLDNPSSNITDRQRSVERTITLSSGLAYNGKLVADNFNANDGVSELTVTVQCDGDQVFQKTLKDGSTDEFGSDNAYSKQLVDNPQENPLKCSGDAVLTADIVYDANTLSGSADDTEIGTGEKIVDLKLVDVYGSTLGSAGTTSVIG